MPYPILPFAAYLLSFSRGFLFFDWWGKLEVVPLRGVDSKVLADVLTVFAHFEGILADKLVKSSVRRGNWADLARKIRIFGLCIVTETRYCVWKQRLRRALEMVLLFLNKM